MAKKIKKHHAWLGLGIVIGSIAAVFIACLVYLRYSSGGLGQTVAPYYQKENFIPPKKYMPPAYIQIEKRTAVKIPIIMYHYVEYVEDVNDLVKRKLAINPYSFEQQIKTLRVNNYETYFVRDLPSIVKETTKISTRSAVLTFDDGYEDFYSVVFPILKKYNVKATAYIIYNYIGRKGFLTKEELTELAKSNLVEIGAHTFDHAYLKFIPTSVLRRQIIDVKKKLEEDLGVTVVTFAYPYGAFGDETVQTVKEATYSAAVSVIPGAIHSKDSLFYLSRIRAGALTSGQSMVRFLDNYNK